MEDTSGCLLGAEIVASGKQTTSDGCYYLSYTIYRCQACLDLSENCNDWAGTGLCDLNPVYMTGKAHLCVAFAVRRWRAIGTSPRESSQEH